MTYHDSRLSITRRLPAGFAFSILAMFMIFTLLQAPAEARTGAQPVSASAPLMDLDQVMVLELEAIFPDLLIAEDEHKAAAVPGPLRFALPADVEVTPNTHGTWEELADGGRLWRLRVSAPNSTDLNFGFGRFLLPEGASLHILSESQAYYEGPYTAADNEKHGELWTPVVPGDRAVVELFVPENPAFEPDLELGRVGRGYRDWFRLADGAAPKQGSCNNDVICPEGDPWRDQIRSVAVYQLSGFWTCTGSMVMDVPGDFRPFFLTAAHCGISSGNDHTMVVYWNFESPVCGQLGGGSLADNQTGAIWRAANSGNDFALVELEEDPDPSFGVFWTGWDASGATPAGSVGIHHPGTDEKAISFNDDPLTTGNSCIGGGTSTHWYVDDWEDGTTEPGSSGSGLWDPSSKLLVGYLSGGLASCTVIDYDCYGKLSVGWGLGVSTWLDPQSSGTLQVQGSDPFPVVGYAGHLGIDSCPADPANENGIWEPGETISLSIDLVATGDFSSVSGTLSTTTPGITITVDSSTWPDLGSGVPATSNSAFMLVIGEQVECLSTIDFELQISTAEGGPFDLSFTHDVGESLTPNVPLPIPDNNSNGVESTLNVGQDVTISDVDVRVEITHTYVGDIRILLRSPAGTEVELLNRPGHPAAPFGCGDADMNITFDDASGFDPEDHCSGTTPWYEGVAAPVGSLADLNGEGTMGTWTLLVQDLANSDTGTLVDWELITTPAVTGQCEVCESGSPTIFSDGFESGDTTAWSATVD